MRKKRLIIPRLVLLILTGISLFLGSIPPSPLYYVKAVRENIQSLFIFGSEDRANWYLTLAEKRITEAEKLKLKKMDFFAKNQIVLAKNYQQEAEKLLETLKDKVDINYLKDKFTQNKERLEKV